MASFLIGLPHYAFWAFLISLIVSIYVAIKSCPVGKVQVPAATTDPIALLRPKTPVFGVLVGLRVALI